MDFNFDFENPEKYLPNQPTDITRARVDKITSGIGDTKLSAYDERFIDSIKKRVLTGKNLTDKQSTHLAKVLSACKSGTYVIKDFRGGYRKREPTYTTGNSLSVIGAACPRDPYWP